jgi:hypothetical protein
MVTISEGLQGKGGEIGSIGKGAVKEVAAEEELDGAGEDLILREEGWRLPEVSFDLETTHMGLVQVVYSNKSSLVRVSAN